MVSFQLHLSHFVSACLETLESDLQKGCTFTVANRRELCFVSTKCCTMLKNAKLLGAASPQNFMVFSLTYLSFLIWKEGKNPSPLWRHCGNKCISICETFWYLIGENYKESHEDINGYFLRAGCIKEVMGLHTPWARRKQNTELLLIKTQILKGILSV